MTMRWTPHAAHWKGATMLSDDKRDELRNEIAAMSGLPASEIVDAIAPLIEQWISEAVADGWERARATIIGPWRVEQW